MTGLYPLNMVLRLYCECEQAASGAMGGALRVYPDDPLQGGPGLQDVLKSANPREPQCSERTFMVFNGLRKRLRLP